MLNFVPCVVEKSNYATVFITSVWGYNGSPNKEQKLPKAIMFHTLNAYSCF